MALVWQCDRCKKISNSGDVADPPEDWERRVLPVRGSAGARSDGAYTLCCECDDDLYAWFYRLSPYAALDGDQNSDGYELSGGRVDG